MSALLLCFVPLNNAQEKEEGAKIKKKKVSYTAPDSGVEMYQRYCAACHGQDGKGGGPVAAELKVPPTDLTALAKQNSGKYPAERVLAVLRHGVSVPAHGTSDMPVWGPVLQSISSPERVVHLRIFNLNRYIESLQRK
ncbi:MAG: cytochrome c [Acidobacteriia bacterium]|nr:cytochrome c [Terriglobia bacterium]